MRVLQRCLRSPFCLLWLTLGLGAVAWTVLFTSLLLWEHTAEDRRLRDTLYLKASLLADNVQEIRRWIGGHGGIYVALQEGVEPNPLLAGIPERDIVTRSGRRLTLFNSPAFLRQISDKFEARTGTRIQLVSDDPINPENVPDPWERSSLEALRAGAGERAEMTDTDKGVYFRLMRPMRLQKGCLDCHDLPAARVGDVVGGLSVQLEGKRDYRAHERAHQTRLIAHGTLWFAGIAGLAVVGWRWRQLLQDLHKAATYDPLTGLFNRRELMRRLNTELKRAERYGDSLCAIMMDIDHFKRVNDDYGHDAGDRVLAGVSDVVRRGLRAPDLAGRYGGEEILILCVNAHMEGACVVAERLRRAISEWRLETSQGPLSVTVSLGVAMYSPGMPAESLVKAADDAMYQAKGAGRNRVVPATGTEGDQ